MRKFNTEGQCNPKLHYMVRLNERIQKIREQYVEQGSYFIINRGRQYGKTTTLWALEEYLKEDYLVVSMDFQGITTEEYRNESTFAKAFMRMFIEALEENETSEKEISPLVEFLENSEYRLLSEMFHVLSKTCKLAS